LLLLFLFLCAVEPSKNPQKPFKSAIIPLVQDNLRCFSFVETVAETFYGLRTLIIVSHGVSPQISLYLPVIHPISFSFPLPHCYPCSGCTKSVSRLQVPGADGNGRVWAHSPVGLYRIVHKRRGSLKKGI